MAVGGLPEVPKTRRGHVGRRRSWRRAALFVTRKIGCREARQRLRERASETTLPPSSPTSRLTAGRAGARNRKELREELRRYSERSGANGDAPPSSRARGFRSDARSTRSRGSRVPGKDLPSPQTSSTKARERSRNRARGFGSRRCKGRGDLTWTVRSYAWSLVREMTRGRGVARIGAESGQPDPSRASRPFVLLVKDSPAHPDGWTRGHPIQG